MHRSENLLIVVFTNTPRKAAHFCGSVDNVSVKQQNLTIFVCWTFHLLLFEKLVQSRNWKFINRRSKTQKTNEK